MESKGDILRQACSATLPAFGCHPGERHTDPEGSTEDERALIAPHRLEYSKGGVGAGTGQRQV